MSKRDKFRRLVAKHPEIKKMSYPEFRQHFRKYDICAPEYGKILREMQGRQEKVVESFKSKVSLITATLRKHIEERGIPAAESMPFSETGLEGKVKPSQFYRVRLRVIEGEKRAAEEYPPVVKVEEVLVKKAKELMALAQAAGYVDIKLENGKLTARRMEEISIAI